MNIKVEREIDVEAVKSALRERAQRNNQGMAGDESRVNKDLLSDAVAIIEALQKQNEANEVYLNDLKEESTELHKTIDSIVNMRRSLEKEHDKMIARKNEYIQLLWDRLKKKEQELRVLKNPSQKQDEHMVDIFSIIFGL